MCWLLARRADVNAADGAGCTALHLAESSALVALLVTLRASVEARDVQERRPLKLALQKGNLEVVEPLGGLESRHALMHM